MKFPPLTDGERETLLQLLDFASYRLDERLPSTKMDQWDGFSVNLARTKVRELRAKLFPDLRTEPSK